MIVSQTWTVLLMRPLIKHGKSGTQIFETLATHRARMPYVLVAEPMCTPRPAVPHCVCRERNRNSHLFFTLLHLAHGRTPSDARGTGIRTTARPEAGEDQRDGEGDEAEPEEGSRGLRLLAALVPVRCAVGDGVLVEVVLRMHNIVSDPSTHTSLSVSRETRGVTNVIAARVHAQLGSERDRAAEPEQRVQRIEHQGDDPAQLNGANEDGGDEVEQGEHGEDGAEHGVVDDGGVAASGVGDHVADEGEDEEGPEELLRVSLRVAVVEEVMVTGMDSPGGLAWPC